MTINRRKFLGAALASTTAGIAFGTPGIVSAAASKETFNLKMTNAYPPGSPFYVQGPGSPTDFCQ